MAATAEPGSQSAEAGIEAGTQFAGLGTNPAAVVEVVGFGPGFAGKNRSIVTGGDSSDHTAAGSHTLADSHLVGTGCTLVGEESSRNTLIGLHYLTVGLLGVRV